MMIDSFLAARITGAAVGGPRPGQGMGLRGPETFVIQIIIIAVALFVIWWLLRSPKSDRVYNKDDTPLDILNKRYAAGEITKEDYDRIKKDIS